MVLRNSFAEAVLRSDRAPHILVTHHVELRDNLRPICDQTAETVPRCGAVVVSHVRDEASQGPVAPSPKSLLS
jgi:hypothetical protein